jgi:hypothetical protein
MTGDPLTKWYFIGGVAGMFVYVGVAIALEKLPINQATVLLIVTTTVSMILGIAGIRAGYRRGKLEGRRASMGAHIFLFTFLLAAGVFFYRWYVSMQGLGLN